MSTPSAAAPTRVASPAANRVDWVDYAKGFCIVMVVMMHSTLGVEQAAGSEGFMHHLVAFAKPFRMPDFFLISGLFLARVIDRDWRTYLDRKVVHFAYFYALWVTIQFAFKAPLFAAEHGWLGVIGLYVESYIEPFGTLWFIYLLPVFFVVTKFARDRRVPPLAIWLIAAALEIAPIATGWTAIDEFAARFVYFYTGYLFAPRIFALAAQVQRQWSAAIAGLLVWAAFNAALVQVGWSELPFVSLGLGIVGAAAVVSFSALLAKLHGNAGWLSALRYCGRNSIVIYLAFFLPMATTRTVLLGIGGLDVGTVSLIVTAAGLIGALMMWWVVRDTRLNFLFARPARFRIVGEPQLALQPAE
jgi:uncharacterized membrane protein YcfT